MDSPETPDQHANGVVSTDTETVPDQHANGVVSRDTETVPVTHERFIRALVALLFVSIVLYALHIILKRFAHSFFHRVLLIALSIAAMPLAAVFVIFCWKGRENQCPINGVEVQDSPPNANDATDELGGDYLTNLIGLPAIFSFQSLEIATESFNKEIGRGGFGKVYEGILTDGTKVAVKCLHDQAGQGQREFCAEIATLSSINHSNLVCLCGVCVEAGHRILVYEFMANGSLDKWLFASEKRLDWKTRYSIALDTARGLAYLHDESRLRILHLDVKPQNILLDQNFHAKLSDFGMARSLNRDLESRVVTGMRGTPGYIAPEWFLESGVTSKSDVFSYGMVLLEIITGSKNVDNSRDSDNWYFPSIAFSQARQGKMGELMESGLKLKRPEDMDDVYRLIKVALWCIQSNWALRPSMGTVVRILEGDSELLDPPLDGKVPFAPWIDDGTQSDGSSESEVIDAAQDRNLLPAPSRNACNQAIGDNGISR